MRCERSSARRKTSADADRRRAASARHRSGVPSLPPLHDFGVVDAEDKQWIKPGVRLPRAGELSPAGGDAASSVSTAAGHRCSRPSIDVLFDSAADAYVRPPHRRRAHRRELGRRKGASRDQTCRRSSSWCRIRRRRGAGKCLRRPSMPCAWRILPCDRIGPFLVRCSTSAGRTAWHMTRTEHPAGRRPAQQPAGARSDPRATWGKPGEGRLRHSRRCASARTTSP